MDAEENLTIGIYAGQQPTERNTRRGDDSFLSVEKFPMAPCVIENGKL